MNRLAVAAAVSLAFSTSAFATGGGLPPQANAAAQANSLAASQAIAGAAANSGAFAGASNSGAAYGNVNAAQGGNATALSGQGGAGFGAAVSAPVQSVTFNGTPAQQTITHNGRQYIENVPNVYAPNIYPTAPCMGSTSVGAGWVGFGFNGGSSWVDTECQLMEGSRNAPTPADRVYVWCKSASAQGAPSCAGLQPQAAANPPTLAPERVSRLEDATVRAAPGTEVWATR